MCYVTGEKSIGKSAKKSHKIGLTFVKVYANIGRLVPPSLKSTKLNTLKKAESIKTQNHLSKLMEIL